MVRYTIKSMKETVEVEEGTPVYNVVTRYQKDFSEPIYGAVVNGKVHDLNYKLCQGGTIDFISATSADGARFYQRTISFLFVAAAKKVFPGCRVTVEHALSGGLYAEVYHGGALTPEDVERIEEKMREMINENIPIHRKVVTREEAVHIFEKYGLHDKAELMRYRDSEKASIYELDGEVNYFYGLMLPSTGYLKHMSLQFYAPGLIIRGTPTEEIGPLVEQRKLFRVYREFERWGQLIGIQNVTELNHRIVDGELGEIVLISEALHEKKLSQLADRITESRPRKKLLLIAGPTSAGKTTFARRLAIEMKINGIHPITISMDDFYLNRDDTPKLPNGEYDFESIEALDIKLFNQTMLNLIQGKTVELPMFNFKTGMREWTGKYFNLKENQIMIVEGIHGLDPRISQYIPEESKFRIYINALTHLNFDDHNRIPTTDYRMIRRIVRDYQFRNTSALETIRQWKNVRHGEDKYIYPNQENADAIFNTSLVYEMSILRKIALPLLKEVTIEMPEFAEANRLIKFLNYFVEGDSKYVPYNSILGEFIGKSCFFV